VDDILISKQPGGLASLPHGATVATGSVRRKHQLLWKRKDLHVVNLRGNVPTRLRKLAGKQWDAIVLARAGLERLGLSPSPGKISFEGSQFFLEILPREIFLPAGGQGIIALQVRAHDQGTKTVVDPINDRETLLCLHAERQFLCALHADCNCPVGVFAKIENGKMKMRAQVFRTESAAPREAAAEGTLADRECLVLELLSRLRA
jgi:hydroxymethylbilane synthase